MPITGSCHCKATRFEVDFAPESVTRCTCSICSRRAGLWAYYKPSQVRFISDVAKASYRWQSHLIGLNFCSVCGCSTYNESPDFSTGEPNFDNPLISINARLFDELDVDAIPVIVLDGKNLW